MRTTILIFAFTISLYLSGQTNKRLSAVLDSLVTEDQKWRELRRRVDNREIDTIDSKTISRHSRLTDSLNFISVQRIFTKYGYPGYDLVGPTSSHNFWLIVQHMDRQPDFQDSVLTKMKAEVENKNASSIDYAYLVDRVNVNMQRPQIYGTQMEVNIDSTSYVPKLLLDPDKVNERRKSVGLSPIEEYIKIMNGRYFGTLKNK
jgi:hypothetical protein